MIVSLMSKGAACSENSDNHEDVDDRHSPQEWRAHPIMKAMHRESHVPAEQGDRGPKQSGENRRSRRAFQGVRLRPRRTARGKNGMQDARRQAHNSAHVDNRKAAMADGVAALRLIY